MTVEYLAQNTETVSIDSYHNYSCILDEGDSELPRRSVDLYPTVLRYEASLIPAFLVVEVFRGRKNRKDSKNCLLDNLNVLIYALTDDKNVVVEVQYGS